MYRRGEGFDQQRIRDATTGNIHPGGGDEDFNKVSSHDLRRYFATHLLFRHEVPAPVVRVLGGWKSDDAMFEYLVLPDDVLFERLGTAGLLRTSYDKLARHDLGEKITATTSCLADLMSEAEEHEVIEAAGANVKKVFEEIERITVDINDRKCIDQDDQSDTEQMSFQRTDFDEKGVTYPAVTGRWHTTYAWSSSRGRLRLVHSGDILPS